MAGKTFYTIRSCRSCNYEGLVDILDLGKQPLANALVDKPGATVRKFPLSTAFCPRCGLFQLRETIPKETLFDHYVWVTGTAKGTQEYSKVFARRVIDRAKIKKGDFVLEIASNDGTILKQFIKEKMVVLGIRAGKEYR